jgi:hypothetical protein
MRYSAVVLCAIVYVSGSDTSQADALDSEDFESFTNVPFEIANADDWTVLAGNEAVVKVVASQLSYQRGPVTVSGGNRALEIGPGMPAATTNNYVDWDFTELAADSLGEFWFSYLLQSSETASTAIPDFEEDRDFFQLHLSAAGDQAQSVSLVLDNQTPVVPGLDADHIFRARSGSSNNVTDTGQNFRNTPTRTQFIVGRVEAVNGEYETISIYANPGSVAAPDEPTARATFDGMNATTLALFTTRISALEPEDFYLLDEIKIGESYGDVVAIDPDFVLGDFDGNGLVDTADFQVLADNIFEGTTYAEGDLDFNGAVDMRDFIAFREVYAAASGQAVAVSVPEPTGFWLLAGACGWLVLRRHRRC